MRPTRLVDLPPPGSSDWHQQVSDALNNLPAFSLFSAATPESALTASRGAIAVNVASSGSVLWIKTAGDGTTGWTALA